jgi:hypothetical protein
MIEFIKGMFLGEDGNPSKNGVMMFIFMTTVMFQIMCQMFFPFIFWSGPSAMYPIRPMPLLPTIPPTYETLVEFVLLILVGGGVAGKVSNAASNVATAMVAKKAE